VPCNLLCYVSSNHFHVGGLGRKLGQHPGVRFRLERHVGGAEPRHVSYWYCCMLCKIIYDINPGKSI